MAVKNHYDFVKVPAFALFLGSSFLFTGCWKLHDPSERPVAGYVPDAQTAVRIAEAVWIPVCGERLFRKEQPLHAELHGKCSPSGTARAARRRSTKGSIAAITAEAQRGLQKEGTASCDLLWRIAKIADDDVNAFFRLVNGSMGVMDGSFPLCHGSTLPGNGFHPMTSNIIPESGVHPAKAFLRSFGFAQDDRIG